MGEVPLPKVLTVTEAAEWLRVSDTVIRRAIASGRLPAIRLGRAYRIDTRIIENMLQNGAVFDEQDDDELED